MVRWGMVIDLRRCVGCQTCTIACKLENALPPGVFWRRVADCEVGEYPDVGRIFLPLGCMQCGDPPCLSVCPTGATQQRQDGIVWVDYDRCVGCGYCAVACPYRARHLIHDEQWYFPDGPTPPEAQMAQPERRGVMTKCTFCLHRLDETAQDGKQPGVDPEATPMCAVSCIANAITFGDLHDPDSPVFWLLKEHQTIRLLEELGTDPSVYYIVG